MGENFFLFEKDLIFLTKIYKWTQREHFNLSINSILCAAHDRIDVKRKCTKKKNVKKREENS